MKGFFLSRVTLRADPSVATLEPILLDAVGRHRSEVSRRVVWTLFADSEDRKRDFLWREDDKLRFYVLSRRPPQDRHHLFTVETKAFEPSLSPGDKLVFSLRANATIARPRGDTKRAGKRDDVVMAALKEIPRDVRVERRAQIVRQEGIAWLRRQGAAAGFDFDDGGVAVNGYEPLTIRGGAKDALRLSVIELDGILTIGEPGKFLAKVALGFGRGKAFGLGLMLVRRPSAAARSGLPS
jgi:CRISPR system Cascade subunit CasE